MHGKIEPKWNKTYFGIFFFIAMMKSVYELDSWYNNNFMIFFHI